MHLEQDWPQIREVFRQADCLLIASVDPEGFPHMTPIGTLCLRDDYTGYYLEHFPRGLRKNLAQCDRVEVLALNHKPGAWLRALWRGHFDCPPGLRLRGHAGERRRATAPERERWRRKVKWLRWTKGHGLLWGDMQHARDLRFEACEPIRLGAMTARLFAECRSPSGGEIHA